MKNNLSDLSLCAQARIVVPAAVAALCLSCGTIVTSFAESQPPPTRREEIHRALFESYTRESKFDDAAAEMQIISQLRPNDPAPHYDCAKSFMNSQEWQAAIPEINNALKLDPQNAEYWHILGNCYMKLSEYKNAVDAFDKAVKNSKSFQHFEAELQVAQQYLERQQAEERFLQQVKHKSK